MKNYIIIPKDKFGNARTHPVSIAKFLRNKSRKEADKILPMFFGVQIHTLDIILSNSKVIQMHIFS